jgi:pimeloyl-ACP methyl ester carboxylesterase
VAALAAPLIPETRALVLISSGGGEPFEETVARIVESEMRKADAPPDAIRKRLEEMKTETREIRAHPVPDREWLSDGQLARNTWLWWADILDVEPLRPLLTVKAPILLVQGEEDQASPSATRIEEGFRRAGKTNLTVRRYPGMGHSPSTKAMDETLAWVVKTMLAPPR